MIPTALLAILGCAFGGLLPDIDEPNAMVSNLPKKGRGAVNATLKKRGIEGVLRGFINAILLVLNFITRAIAGSIKSLAGHRGATHWMVSSVVVGVIFAALGLLLGGYPELGLWIFLGYASHIALDAMTLSGVEMWQPFSSRKIHLLPDGFRVRTGSFVDLGLGLILGSIAAILIYSVIVASMAQEFTEAIAQLLRWFPHFNLSDFKFW